MRKVIVAPLNWGLGHASRCVPIIKNLIENKFTPVLASDGKALLFLQKEFPKLETLELPSYHISYGKNVKRSLLRKIPLINKAVKEERKTLQTYLAKTTEVVGIISDNRFGIYDKHIPSVYITHQLNVLSGMFTSITSYFHQQIIRNYHECWIPDEPVSKFSGRLSNSKKELHQKYIGILSRFHKKEVAQEIDILILLSGPEPSRTELELKLKELSLKSQQKIVLVRGVVEERQKVTETDNLKLVNFMLSEELEASMNAAKLVICRSGYSSIMDLISLGKKALLIPTEGQSEQEYLANYLQDKGLFKVVREKDLYEDVLKFSGKDFQKSPFQNKALPSDLFNLFLK